MPTVTPNKEKLELMSPELMQSVVGRVLKSVQRLGGGGGGGVCGVIALPQ